jgi:hypothetical protein
VAFVQVPDEVKVDTPTIPATATPKPDEDAPDPRFTVSPEPPIVMVLPLCGIIVSTDA